MRQLFFQRIHAAAQRVIIVRRQLTQPNHTQLRFNAAVCRVRNAQQRFLQNFCVREQARSRYLPAQLLDGLIRIRRRQQGGNILLARLDQQHIPNESEQLIEHGAQLSACGVALSELLHRGGQIARQNMPHQIDGGIARQNANTGSHAFLVNWLAAARCRAVENGQRITQGAVRQPRNHARAAVGQRNRFFLRDFLEPHRNVMRRNAAEIKPLTARQNRRRYLIDFCGCQNKQHVLRRLLQRLEQRIERALRQHMYLVDDVHALFDGRRCIPHFVTNVADVVYAVVGRCVNLDNIQNAAVHDAAARRTGAARVTRLQIGAVDRTRQNFRTGRLAGAARAGEQIGMGQASAFQLRAKRIRDVPLSDHIGKFRRPPFAVQCLIHAFPSQSWKNGQSKLPVYIPCILHGTMLRMTAPSR